MLLNNKYIQLRANKISIILLAMIIYIICPAQYQDHQMYFHGAPKSSIFSFEKDTITRVDRVIDIEPITISYSSICDTDGLMQFHCNNHNIFDKNFNIITSIPTVNEKYLYSGESINGQILLDFPNSDKVVCISTEFDSIGNQPPFGGDYFITKAYISYIDRYANTGLGKATEGKELIKMIDDTLCLPVAACRHANGSDWWVVLRKFRSNNFFIVLVTPKGYSVKEQIIGNKLPLIYGILGKAIFSNNGEIFIFGISLGNSFSIAPWYFDVFNFDRCSGILSNQRKINITDIYNARVQGVAISPNNRYLYVGLTRKLFQYDLWASNLDSSAVFIDTAAYNSYVGDMRLAPDGKIYITPSWIGEYWSTIEYPDSAGIACNFRHNTFQLSRYDYANYCFPNMPCFTLGRDSIAFGCDTLSTVGIEPNPLPDKYIINVYPNPSEDIIYIQSNNMISSYEIIDLTGKLLQKNNQLSDHYELNIQYFTSGIYIIKLYTGDEVVVRKIIKKQ